MIDPLPRITLAAHNLLKNPHLYPLLRISTTTTVIE